jgi:hypothetical protein
MAKRRKPEAGGGPSTLLGVTNEAYDVREMPTRAAYQCSTAAPIAPATSTMAA